MACKPAPIIIADYDSRWPAMFEAERERLQQAVGHWVAGIEHIGSTAVPHLAAKPVIDILVGVRALAAADVHCIRPICGLGYEYIAEFEKFIPERRYFRLLSDPTTHTHHIHLVERRSEFWRRHLLFRDYLRAHPDRARQYEALKRRLAPQFSDVNDYAQAKTEFIRAVEASARDWRPSTLP
ncbi:MAG TPA: GrpB family protein [Lacipirellulaceae bacterium]